MLILGFIDIPMWILTIIFLLVGFYIYTEKKHRKFVKCGLPGPKPAPFVGGLPLLQKKGLMMCEYEGTLEYGKCFGFFLGNLPTVFVTDTEVIKEIFVKRFSAFPVRSQAAYITKFWEKTVLMSTDHDHWKFLRSTLLPSFSSGKLKRINPLVLSCLDKMVEKISNQLKTSDVVEMSAVVRGLSLDIICRSAFSVEIEQNEEFVKQVTSLLNFSLEKNPMLTLILLIPDAKYVCKLFDIDYNNTRAIKYIGKVLAEIIEEKKKNPSQRKEDLLQLMIDSHKDILQAQSDTPDQSRIGMTDDEISANAITFLFAGQDTTSTALTFSVFFLATEQDCQEKLRREIVEAIGDAEPTYENVNELKYLEMFISEAMRLYPPVTRINRQNSQETIIGQYTFPSGISITVPVFTLHRLEEYWPEPLKFDPERFSPENKQNIVPFSYLPFGAGPRNCLGMRFAQMELKITLVKLIQNFRFRPSDSLIIPPQLEKNVFCRPKGGMPLIVEKVKD